MDIMGRSYMLIATVTLLTHWEFKELPEKSLCYHLTIVSSYMFLVTTLARSATCLAIFSLTEQQRYSNTQR